MSSAEVLTRIRARPLRSGACTVRVLERHTAAGARRRGHPLPHARPLDRKQRRWLQGYFAERDPAGAVAAGSGSRPSSFPAHPQQEPQPGRRAQRGKDAFGREATWLLVRAPRSLLHHPPAGQKWPSSPTIRLSRRHPAAVRRRDVPGHGRRRGLVPVPRDAQQRAGGGRERWRTSPPRWPTRSWPVAAMPDRCAWSSPSCPKPIAEDADGELRAQRAGHLPLRRAVSINRIIAIYDQVEQPDLKFPKFAARSAPALGKPRQSVRGDPRQDVLLHHLRILRRGDGAAALRASVDRTCWRSKQTLYRVGDNSPWSTILSTLRARAGM